MGKLRLVGSFVDQWAWDGKIYLPVLGISCGFGGDQWSFIWVGITLAGARELNSHPSMYSTAVPLLLPPGAARAVLGSRGDLRGGHLEQPSVAATTMERGVWRAGRAATLVIGRECGGGRACIGIGGWKAVRRRAGRAATFETWGWQFFFSGVGMFWNLDRDGRLFFSECGRSV